MLEARGRLPILPALPEPVDDILVIASEDVDLTEFGVVERAALGLRRRVRQIAVRGEIPVEVSPRPSGAYDGRERGIGLACERDDLGRLQISAKSPLDRSLAVMKHIV